MENFVWDTGVAIRIRKIFKQPISEEDAASLNRIDLGSSHLSFIDRLNLLVGENKHTREKPEKMSLNVSGKELRKIFAIVTICFLVSHIRRKEARKRWLGSEKKAHDSSDQEKPQTRLVDHPFVPYLIENAAIIGLPYLVRKVGVIDPQRPILSFLSFQLQSTILVNSALAMQKFCADYLYGHVPYFTKTRPSSDWKDMAWDFMRNNFWNDVFLSFMQVMLIRSIPTDRREAKHQVPFKVFPFLGKIIVGRFIVDVVFYLVHRWLHTDFGYKYIHYRHHEHRSPRTQTNFHFVPLDLFLGKFATNPTAD